MGIPPAAPKLNPSPLKLLHGGRKKPSAEGEGGNEDGGDGNWIVSYADMMTLLCVFFIIMFSLSKIDPKKIEEAKRDTVEFMGGKYSVPYEGMVEKIRKVLIEKNLEKQVQVDSDETGVSIIFRGTVFFESGSASILDDGKDILMKLSDVIKKEAPNFKIVVEGHTDDVPIVSPTFPSNWELSAARASSVIRLFEVLGFKRDLLTAVGYSDTRPVAPNLDEKGVPIPNNRATNRRVVIKVLKDGVTGP